MTLRRRSALEGQGDAYTLRIEIDPEWVDLLSITPSDATVEGTSPSRIAGHVGGRARRPPRPRPRRPSPSPSTPIVTEPDPATLPDFFALPAWRIGIKRGYLTFNATEWNAGPGPMVVDGFRGDAESTMDAYQYFL